MGIANSLSQVVPARPRTFVDEDDRRHIPPTTSRDPKFPKPPALDAGRILSLENLVYRERGAILNQTFGDYRVQIHRFVRDGNVEWRVKFVSGPAGAKLPTAKKADADLGAALRTLFRTIDPNFDRPDPAALRKPGRRAREEWAMAVAEDAGRAHNSFRCKRRLGPFNLAVARRIKGRGSDHPREVWEVRLATPPPGTQLPPLKSTRENLTTALHTLFERLFDETAASFGV